VETRNHRHRSAADRSGTHGARPGYVAALLFVAAVSVHFLCCEWNADRQRGRIVSFVYARPSFVYASESGEEAYNTGLAAICGLVIPGLMGAGAAAIVIYECAIRIRRRTAQRKSRRGVSGPSGHLRSVARRGRRQ